MNEKEKWTNLKRYSVAGTILSGYFTAHFMYLLLPEEMGGLRILVGILVVVMLDGGFWVWDNALPLSRSDNQRKLAKAALVIWWALMLITSLGDGFLNAENAGIGKGEFWTGISVFVVSGIGNLAVAWYAFHRFSDPDMLDELAKIKSRIARNKLKRGYAEQIEKDIGWKYAQHEAVAEADEEYRERFGKKMPRKVLEKDQKTVVSNQNGPKPAKKERA